MQLGWHHKFIPNKYSQLLSITILLFIISPIFEGVTGRIIIGVLFFGTILAIIRTFNLTKRFFFLLLTLIAAAFTLDIYTSVQVNSEGIEFLKFTVTVTYSLVILTALITINRKIFLVKKVTGDTIKGGIAVFFLVGIFWSLLYVMVYYFDPNAFSESIEPLDVIDSMFYFSFTTLTTLGYGDLTPVSSIAKTLANLEAVTGLMYPSIFIARLVGLYTAQEMNEDH
ncbi:MAG: ion channel [Xenococcaceae cyanobacterium MO_188.B19]|nr:ion channel [Xenococcaceae cyanobacterium MO_188.B19]